MFVKPSKSNPAAIRKARWEAEQKAKHGVLVNALAKGVEAKKG